MNIDRRVISGEKISGNLTCASPSLFPKDQAVRRRKRLPERFRRRYVVALLRRAFRARAMPRYSDVPERVDFPDQETETLKYWAEHKTFEESVRRSEGKPIWSFYDGPPFATGLPHYGHLLAGTIKDIMCRYAHQTGHYVERRFGWDCHGLPVEFEIDKKLGISGREDVLKMGVAKYNAECRSIVMRYSKEWEITVKRIGRWISFENDYKTMHLSFMESVWWVFGQLHAKGLVYRGFKVMPYSCPCNTPLSNFEVQQNYKTVDDPAVVCAFPLVSDPNTKFIAWTTTPWTLPSNLALCVNPTMEYVKVEDESGVNYILMAARLVQLYPDLANPKKQKEAEKKFKEVERFPGKQLLGTEYSPPFEYFIERMKGSGAFKVITGDFVTDDAGTGIVHCAPAFGEEDYKVRLRGAHVRALVRRTTRGQPPHTHSRSHSRHFSHLRRIWQSVAPFCGPRRSACSQSSAHSELP